MFKNRKLSIIGLLLIMALSLSLVVGCGSDADKKPVETHEEEQTQQVDAQEVIKAAANKYYEKMPDNKYKIKVQEVNALLESGDLADYLVVDIRSQESYDKGHIEGAIFIPFGEVGNNLDLIATNAKGKRAVFVVCNTGQTAGQTVAILNMLGIPSKSISSGMTRGWNAEGLPTVTEPTEPKAAEAYNWGDKAPIKEAAEKYYAKMPKDGLFKKYKISQADLKEQLETNPEKLVVIDLRKAEDYAAGTIAGATHVDFKDVHNHFDEIAEMAKGKTAVVACYSGQTAAQTDAVLNMLGIKTVSLNLGIREGWVKDSGFEVVTP